MSVYEILRVLYAPQKAFKEITQNPKYVGPIVITILFVLANTGFIYIIINKTYVEQTQSPVLQGDAWTENASLWTSIIGETPTANSNDYVNGSYYIGNKSIQFKSVNNKQIAMQLSDIGPVNCSGAEGFTKLSIRIKWTSPSTKPENATIYLFSGNVSNNFKYNLTRNLENSTSNVWNNFTIQLVTDWISSSMATNWDNITGLRLEFSWLETSNITLLIDGLFFRGVFKLSAENIPSSVFSFSLYTFMQFFLRWVFLSGLIYIMSKTLFNANIVWKSLLIATGFALMPMLIQALISITAYSTLPTLYYPLEFFSGAAVENEIVYHNITQKTWLVSQIGRYLEIIVLLWIIILGSIVTRLLTTFSWSKSIPISIIAYFVAVFAQSFLLGI
ncbi:hypothetical protein HXY32_00545 [Candidatus Bathyarchaeota archaeon]|nr:hypothetical protein [Candidatus Bathyarchaeota archaeon]